MLRVLLFENQLTPPHLNFCPSSATDREGPAADQDRRLGGRPDQRAAGDGAVALRPQPPRLAEAAGRCGREEG